jgi:hypothetical protein
MEQVAEKTFLALFPDVFSVLNGRAEAHKIIGAFLAPVRFLSHSTIINNGDDRS